ncbi:MAG: chromosomal replication initiator protein DnaA [Eikenella sp.]|nr:chromosomal replication initiator protein DnaA [Eikenella sp.]
MTLEQFWLRCLHHLHHTLPEQQYQTWIAPLSVGEGAAGEWVVYAPSVFALNMLRQTYAAQIRSLIQQWLPENPPILLLQKGQGRHYDMAAADSGAARAAATGKPAPAKPKKTAPPPPPAESNAQRSAVDIVAARLHQIQTNDAGGEKNHSGAAEAPATAKPAAAPKSSKPKTAAEEQQQQWYEQSHLSPDYTFDNLVEGKGNRLAVAAGQSIAESLGKSQYNPFFLYGSTGLGKTHLVQAIGNRVLALNPRAKVRYMHSDDYLRSMMSSFRNNAYDAFKQQYKQYDLLIIDDIQFIKGKERTMEEFFHLYNHFHSHKKQIILTCDVLPTLIEELDERLKSRFSWGLTLELEPPELEMRVQILQKKAALSGADLSEEAAFFIAKHIRSNVRELEGAFNRVLARSQFTGKPIDQALAADALKDIVASKHKLITPELIIATVGKYYGVKDSDLTGKKRTQSIVRPRQIAMNLCKDLTDLSLSAIGEAFGKRDHSTVINAVEKAGRLREEQPELAKDYEKLLILIKN